MMSTAVCRAKALEAIQKASASTDPQLAKQWRETAKEWSALALVIEKQESLRRHLEDKPPD
jgi:hypothetical protein